MLVDAVECGVCVPMPPGVGKRRLSMLELVPSETNPLRRGGPLCPPARIEFDWPSVPLHSWMFACAVDVSRACRGRRMLSKILSGVRFG